MTIALSQGIRNFYNSKKPQLRGFRNLEKLPTLKDPESVQGFGARKVPSYSLIKRQLS